MVEQLLLTLLSAVIGGFVGTLISSSLPKLLFGPRIKIVGIEPHGFAWRLIVVNIGRTAATNAVGRITIRPIDQGDVIGTREEILEARKQRVPGSDWRTSIDAHLRAEEWQLGIEQEHVLWATSPGEAIHLTTLNPNLPERLVIACSKGAWVDISSEHAQTKRARLKLDSTKMYYGEVTVGAENSAPSKPFCFQIRLGEGETAVVEP